MARPKLAVWKFASCDGCQLSLLDLEDDLLAIAERVEIAHFLEASSRVTGGPYALSLVEGSIATPEQAERIREVRAQSEALVAIGACATAGGIQALRNFADADAFRRAVYPKPEMIAALATATPISDHVPVDLELRGCPVSTAQLRELVTATLAGRRPRLPNETQCAECKRAGTVCVMVSRGVPCLGPATRAGCGNLCPSLGRGCYGCFGPVGEAETAALAARFRALGLDGRAIRDLFRSFNAAAPAFAEESRKHG
jgi:coenzyme F420-reducing hydrogenase gamma subunit